VVWEALGDVDGDTQLVDAAFRPFRPHASQQHAQHAQRDAEWEATVAAAAAAGESAAQGWPRACTALLSP
jgi:hypothetical protein